MNDINQTAWNNDPIKQPIDIKSVKETDPKHPPITDNPKTVPHQALAQPDPPNKNSGRDIGIEGAGVVSINPTSGQQAQTKEKPYRFVDNANQELNRAIKQPDDYKYPFADIKLGQGVFVPVKAGSTTDAQMADVHQQIDYYREHNSEVEKNKDGDDVWESVIVKTKKRLDGVIELDGLGKPVEGANQTNRPKLIHAENFIARPVVSGDNIGDGGKAESDGVLIIRVL